MRRYWSLFWRPVRQITAMMAVTFSVLMVLAVGLQVALSASLIQVGKASGISQLNGGSQST